MILFKLFFGAWNVMAALIQPQVSKLPNGMEIIVIPNGVSPTVDISILYRVGSADGLIGLAHYLEHMMFMGTKNIPHDQFKKTIRRFGGDSNAFTYYDYTVYQTKIAVQHLDFVLKLEADRMQNLTFTKKEIDSERNVVLQERLMRLENHPFGYAYEAEIAAMYREHPYGLAAIGRKGDIEQYTYEVTRKYYETWYAPNNAVLIVTGKTTLEEVMKSVNKYFAGFSAKALPKRYRPQESPRQGLTTKIVQHNPRNAMIMVSFGYDAPHHKDRKPELFFPTIVLRQILGGNVTTKLWRTFVDEKKLALSVSASFDAYRYDPSDFSMSAVLAPGVSMETFKQEFKAYIDNLLKKGIPEQDVIEAKNDIVGQMAFMRDGNSNAIEHLVGLACKFDLETLTHWADKIMAVTPQQVNQALHYIFDQEPVVTTELYPEKKKAEESVQRPASELMPR